MIETKLLSDLYKTHIKQMGRGDSASINQTTLPVNSSLRGMGGRVSFFFFFFRVKPPRQFPSLIWPFMPSNTIWPPVVPTLGQTARYILIGSGLSEDILARIW